MFVFHILLIRFKIILKNAFITIADIIFVINFFPSNFTYFEDLSMTSSDFPLVSFIKVTKIKPKQQLTAKNSTNPCK